MENERILLRHWHETDAEALYKYASDPEVGPQAGWAPHQSVEESRQIIREIFGQDFMWAIIWKETNEPIGCVGYLPSGMGNIEMGENDGEVGYWMAKPYWNRGICTEALRMVVDYCFTVKGFDTLWGDFFVDNPASGRVMVKCGFEDTGRELYCEHLYGGSERLVRVLKLNNYCKNKMEKQIVIRPACEQDYEFILKTNLDNVEVLSPMNADRLKFLATITEQFLVAEVDGQSAAFLMALREGADRYDSENYRWFSAKYDAFLYVDRIVIAEPYRHLGIGTRLYQAVFDHAKELRIPFVTCEVDTIPYNEISLNFHKKMGFREVGTQYVHLNGVTVSLQEARVNE